MNGSQRSQWSLNTVPAGGRQAGVLVNSAVSRLVNTLNAHFTGRSPLFRRMHFIYIHYVSYSALEWLPPFVAKPFVHGSWSKKSFSVIWTSLCNGVLHCPTQRLVQRPINNGLYRIVLRCSYCTETDVSMDSHWALSVSVSGNTRNEIKITAALLRKLRIFTKCPSCCSSFHLKLSDLVSWQHFGYKEESGLYHLRYAHRKTRGRKGRKVFCVSPVVPQHLLTLSKKRKMNSKWIYKV